MDRTFLLPLTALSLVGTTGCLRSGIVGEWAATSSQYGSDVYVLPEVTVDVYGGETYTEVFGIRLTAESDGSARIGTYYVYSSSLGDYELEQYTYAGTWERVGGAFALSFDEDELDLSCARDGGELLCVDIEGDLTLTFQGAENDLGEIPD
jgi:hypothetical protein